MSKPTFLTLSSSLAFRNGEHMTHEWEPYLNGTRIAACEADTERGYVDAITMIDKDNSARRLLIHRLFGSVEFKATCEAELWASTDECNDCKD